MDATCPGRLLVPWKGSKSTCEAMKSWSAESAKHDGDCRSSRLDRRATRLGRVGDPAARKDCPGPQALVLVLPRRHHPVSLRNPGLYGNLAVALLPSRRQRSV